MEWLIGAIVVLYLIVGLFTMFFMTWLDPDLKARESSLLFLLVMAVVVWPVYFMALAATGGK